MSIQLGNTIIGSIYLGSAKIAEAYVGNVKVLSSGPRVYHVNCSGSHGTVVASPSSGISGTVVTLSNVADTGYTFDSYTVTGATLSGNTFVIGESNVTVVGNFTGIVRNVTCSATNGTVSASPNSGIIGTTVTLSNTPDSGYAFDSYTLTGATLKNSNQFDIGTSDVSVVGNFTQSSAELWVDLGSATYSVSNRGSKYIALTGMPSSTSKKYFTAKFNLSGNALAPGSSLSARGLGVLCKASTEGTAVAGCYVKSSWYSNGSAVGNKFAFGVAGWGDAGTVYSSDFVIGHSAKSSSTPDYMCVKKTAMSTGVNAIKYVCDIDNKTVYYYLNGTLVGSVVNTNAISLTNAAELYMRSPTSSTTATISNIKVAGFSTLAEAQAW